MTADQSTSTTTLTARTPEDILAVVPVVLGFEPTESLVMLTFGGDPPFHARVDLPERRRRGRRGWPPRWSSRPRQPRVPRVFLVAYSERDRFADRRSAGDGAGAAARGRRGDRRAAHRRPSVATGAGPPRGAARRGALRPVRAPLRRPGRVRRSRRARLPRPTGGDASSPTPTGSPGSCRRWPRSPTTRSPALDEGRWARELVVRHVDSGTTPDDAEVARLLRGLLDLRVRDAAWSPLCRDAGPRARGVLDRRRTARARPAGAGAGRAAGLRGVAGRSGSARVVCRRPVRRGRPGLLAGRPGRRAARPGRCRPTPGRVGFDWTAGLGR